MNWTHLLQKYRQIWNNRTLETMDQSEELTLKEAIMRELKDENTHPRVRKTVEEKFFLATNRITESSLTDIEKLKLIELHIEQANDIRGV
ncbi:hypothetical protein LS684_12305 [Cytobacillus spongiae]|uniref:hypothetical protein n=1 Tax=Cytobacillus spongiae TaxID=2901381 RepID=UPI001F204CB6|nr:hypothetical protein [Cytobacillus spongiae]UII54457.1 hypothetical protein LS684_12305 [Cytobacillus spongiae]